MQVWPDKAELRGTSLAIQEIQELRARNHCLPMQPVQGVRALGAPSDQRVRERAVWSRFPVNG
jgi:hypothetical protein